MPVKAQACQTKKHMFMCLDYLMFCLKMSIIHAKKILVLINIWNFTY